MRALFILPALLDTAFLIDTLSDDDDDTVETSTEPKIDETIELTEENDLFLGDGDAERVLGGDGDDTLHGQGGTDILLGEAGADSLTGGQDNDTLYGGDENDTLHGQGGSDVLHGEVGDDYLEGDEGNDTIYGGEGNDTSYGGAGNDRIFLGAGRDVHVAEDLAEANGEDAGDDFIRGGGGADFIADGLGSNTLHGDTGNDYLSGLESHQFNEPHSPDTLDGGIGDDRLIGDDGDLLIGGEGADQFTVRHAYADDREAVIIDDFDTNEDALAIYLSDSALAPDQDELGQIVMELNEMTGEITVSSGGEVLTILRNMTEEDLDALTLQTYFS